MFDTPTEKEMEFFLETALSEGWRVPRNELALLRGAFSESMTVLRPDDAPIGFVSALRHEKSGWIGNLIVPPGERGKGYGALLFERALQRLVADDATTVWLTASEEGRPIYEKRGFRTIGYIRRWRGVGRGNLQAGVGAEITTLLDHDERSWGDDRSALLRCLCEGGKIVASGSTSALLQDGGDFAILGPWLSLSGCPRENRLVLTAAIEAAPYGVEIVTDLFESSPVAPLLTVAGFEQMGRCDLMVYGSLEAELEKVNSLATLGSLG